jgi:hypothetical protein
VHHAKPKPARRPKHKRHKKKVKHVAVAPKPKAQVKAQVKGANVVRVAGVPAAAVTTNQGDQARNTAVIAATTLAALIFLLVVTVPTTRARFTGPGRMVMDHQTDLVLAGVTVLVLAVIIFALSGIAS